MRAAKEDREFPDEVDTPLKQPARVRFGKYRGLQSFRHTPWDPKEDLPPQYARIFKFSNFDHTRRRILKQLSAKQTDEEVTYLYKRERGERRGNGWRQKEKRGERAQVKRQVFATRAQLFLCLGAHLFLCVLSVCCLDFATTADGAVSGQ